MYVYLHTNKIERMYGRICNRLVIVVASGDVRLQGNFQILHTFPIIFFFNANVLLQ